MIFLEKWKDRPLFQTLIKEINIFLHFNFNFINFGKKTIPLKSREVGASQKKNLPLPSPRVVFTLGSPCGAWSARSRDSEASRWWCWCSWCFPRRQGKVVAGWFLEGKGVPSCFVFFFFAVEKKLENDDTFVCLLEKKDYITFPAPLQKKLWNENSSFLWNCKRESENCGKLKFHIVLYDFFVVFKFQYPDLRMNDSLLPASQPHGQSPIRGMFGSFRNFGLEDTPPNFFFGNIHPSEFTSWWF